MHLSGRRAFHTAVATRDDSEERTLTPEEAAEEDRRAFHSAAATGDDSEEDSEDDSDSDSDWDSEDDSEDDPEECPLTPEEVAELKGLRRILFSKAKSSVDVSEKDINKYYFFHELMVPEALEEFYEGRRLQPLTPEETEVEDMEIHPVYRATCGCKGLQEEMEHTGYAYLLWRASTHLLRNVAMEVQAQLPGSRQRVLLRGAKGSGKSLTLVALVEWARRSDWIVLYHPDVQELTHGGSFSRNTSTGMYDTPAAVKEMLRFFLLSHQEQLKELPQRLPGGSGSLLDLVNAGLSSGAAAKTCNVLVRLKHELYLVEEVPVLIALDSYNALHWRTGYGEWTSEQSRRELSPDELTAARAMQVLRDEDVGRAMVVVATSESCSASSKLQLPLHDNCAQDLLDVEVPRLSVEELTSMMHYLAYIGWLPDAPREEDVHHAAQVTGGNGYELRQLCPVLLPYDPMLDADADWDGLSRHKKSVRTFLPKR